MNTSDRMSDADLNAYVDSELDSASRLKLERWLAGHPADAARVEAYRQQNAELQNLFNPVVDEPVPSTLLELVKNSGPRPGKPVWMQVAAGIVLVLAGAVGGWGLRGLQEFPGIASTPNYVERAVGAHIIYAAEVRHPVEVEAAQEEHLVAWLSKRLGNPLKAPSLVPVGYQLIGGRLLEDSGSPAAQFMYEDSVGGRVTVYVRSYEGKDTAFKFFNNDRVSAFYWVDAPFAYALIGAIDVIFHQAEECRRVTGIDPSDPAEIEAHSRAVEYMVLGRSPGDTHS